MATTHPDPPTDPAMYPLADEENRFLVIPDEVWRPATQEYEEHLAEEDKSEEDEDYEPEGERRPISRNAVSMIGGVAASLVAGMIPSLLVDLPGALAGGVAAGIFGGLMGASLANEFYDRRHPESR
jgi:hypothetical protein